MGKAGRPTQVMPVVAIFSREGEAREWASQRLAQVWGDCALRSTALPFEETTYYNPTMGDNLRLELLCFATLASPKELNEWKSFCNTLELELASTKRYNCPRPVNIDPGYLNYWQFVLASTKEAPHRLYYGQGIFAELTLIYQSGAWQELPWTYPNYRRREYKDFLKECREKIYKTLMV